MASPSRSAPHWGERALLARVMLVPAVAIALAGCSSAVAIDAPDLDPGQRAACDRLVDSLPPTLADLGSVEVEPAGAPGAAYGDPAIVVTCGVVLPAGFDRFAVCEEADGVGWFVPEEQITDEPTEVTLTAAGYRPRVEVVVPADYWPSGSAAVTAELADAVTQTLELVEPCR